MPAIQHYGQYAEGYEDLLNDRVNRAWNSNTTFSERAWAESTQMGCLNMHDSNRGCKSSAGACPGGRQQHVKCKSGSKDTSQYDTFKCIPMRAQLNAHPDLDHHETGRIFNPKYDDKRYLRPDIPIPDDYATDSDGFCGPKDQEDTRYGYGEMDPLGDGGPKLVDKRLRPRRKKTASKTAKASMATGKSDCNVSTVRPDQLLGCTAGAVKDIVTDLSNWSQVPGKTPLDKLGYTFGSHDRPFYLGLLLVVLLVVVLALRFIGSMFKGHTAGQRYIIV